MNPDTVVQIMLWGVLIFGFLVGVGVGRASRG